MRRYAWRDDPWERIKPFLPGRVGPVGGTAVDNRLFVEAVLYRYRAGVPWRDLPERFGDGKNVPRRGSRWAESGVWKKVFQCLAGEAENEYAMLDSPMVRAHQPSAGAQKKRVQVKPWAAAKAGGARRCRPRSMPWATRLAFC
jgi:transposase